VPIYVYECSSPSGCGERFEYTQSIHEPAKTVCENCGGKLEKVIVPIAFHLKGGGWGKDLYSSKKTVSSQSADEAKSDSKSEKAEPKAETKKTESSSTTKPSGSSGGDK
jgi:putative FmdB family regulatory protein